MDSTCPAQSAAQLANILCLSLSILFFIALYSGFTEHCIQSPRYLLFDFLITLFSLSFCESFSISEILDCIKSMNCFLLSGLTAIKDFSAYIGNCFEGHLFSCSINKGKAVCEYSFILANLAKIPTPWSMVITEPLSIAEIINGNNSKKP